MFSFTMGNEESHDSGVDLDNDAVEVTDNWTLYYAHNVNGNSSIRSAFISQQGTSESLMRLSKNLMIHRHPCIVQFISSWSKNGSYYLITEEVKPLAHVLGNQSALQICIGLHSILKALNFLHEKAQASHNNVCCASVYVTPEGVWKLGGLNYLKKFSDVTPSYLQESRAHRYEKAVSPEEDNLLSSSRLIPEAIDQFAFGVLVEEVLKKKSNDEIPHLSDFKAFCKKKLSLSDPSKRAKLSEVMSHQFFNHDFLKIHKFLSELPLKLNHEKEQFFRDLTVQLSLLPEEIVASQLASLLLSRIVILDSTAQQHLLPIILQPKTGDKGESTALFSEDAFKRHIVPKLLQMFCVRDAQVRLILLTHFRLFCDAFTTEQLKHQVLPELLMGIKDVNDQLVSTTLKALADLVLILGSTTVIGGKRFKLFTDGRPKAHDSSMNECNPLKVKERSRGSPLKNNVLFGGSELPERLSPDGGEDNTSSTTLGGELDVDNWSDWESPVEKETAESDGKDAAEYERVPVQESKSLQKVNPQPLPDITALDIKCNKTSKIDSTRDGDSEIDFFRDMEPVISKTQSLIVTHVSDNKFDMNHEGVDDIGSGWDDDWESGEENNAT